jgi:crotonobetainyl-CoA:carnitine CoA-transferase CaiB-like acyl-CoA transferase
MIAAPLACTLLADFGADVIKIEHPTQGDAMRTRPPEKDGRSLWWKVIARNKRTIRSMCRLPKVRIY